MKTKSWRAAALAATALLLAAAPPAPPAPPPTARHDVVTTYHGITIHDPYRWLEDGTAPAVQQWIDAQNAYTEAVMAGIPDREAIVRRVGELALTSTQRSGAQLAGGRLFYLRETPPQPQDVLVVEDWPQPQGAARVLVDPNAAGGDVAITAYWPSPDGRQVAYGTASGGDENTTIHFVAVADGQVAADALPYAGGGTSPQALSWDADGRGVTYMRLPRPGTVPAAREQFDGALFHHTLGTPAESDTPVLGQGFSPIAEYQLFTSAQGAAAALVHYGDGEPSMLYLRSGGTWRRVLGTEAKLVTDNKFDIAAAWDERGRLLVPSYENAPRGKLLAVSAEGTVQVLLPQQDWAIAGVTAVRGGFILLEVSGPDWRARHFSADGHLVRTVPLPATGIGIDELAGSAASPAVLIGWTGWGLPSRWARYDADSGALTPVFEVKPAADYSKVRATRLDATSADGTAVPVTVLSLEGAQPDGHRPTILYAYGGYGYDQMPRFIGPRLAWLERGGAWALANIRGGGEYGEGWHEGGRRALKQHCFDDFHAAARALVAARWTDAAHLGINGGSNGGLLMGAALTQHPQEYRAVVSFVGIYDMLRAELFPNGEYNIREYGTVGKAEEFAWLRAYSPLLRVRAGTAYPAVLLITGENDPRVAPWQSRKFAAALQAANTGAHPVLLLTRRNEGHGVTASFSQRVGNTGAMLTFMAGELGLASQPPAADGSSSSR